MTASRADTPGVVARPPLLYLAFLAVGLGLDYLWPVPLVPGGLPNAVQYALGAVLLSLGVGLMAACMRRLRRAGTPVETWKPTTALVSDGPFRFSRNPIYVALTLMYAGIGVAADALWAFVLLVPLLVIMHVGVVVREERYLEGKFGEAYRRYRDSVRRWL